MRHCWRGLNSATLLVRKHDALAGHDIGTLQDATNRREGDKAAQVLWVAILKRKDRRNLPGSNHVRQPALLEKTLPLAKGKLVDQSRSEALAYVERRQAAFEAQIPFILRTRTLIKILHRDIAVVNRLGPGK